MALDLRFSLIVPVIAIVGCKGMIGSAGPQVEGTGPKVSETRTVKSFSKVSINSAFEADIKFGDKESVEIEAQKSILPHLVTRVDGDKLTVETSGSISTNKGMVVHIVMKKLDSVDASGAANVTVDPFTVADFDVKADGASKIHLSGKADKVHVDAEGASTVDADKLETKEATATASGASTVHLGTSKSLDVEANGASTISYVGNPTIKRSESNGASSIQPKG